MTRRYGEPVEAGRDYVHRPGAYAVISRGKDILVTHQAEPRSEFQLPGGGIDDGESTLSALYREVFEETGWKIAKPRRLGVFRRYTFMPEYGYWAEKVCHIFLAWPVRRLSAPTEDGHTAVWMSSAEAISMLANEGDRDFVRAAFGEP